MTWFYDAVLRLHVLGSVVGLFSLLVPLMAAKGGRLHVRAGFVFSAGMAISVATGLLIAASWVAIPDLVKVLPEHNRAEAISKLRSFGLFFGLLSTLAGHALIAGLGATRNRSGQAPGWVHARRYALFVLLGLASVVLVVGVTQLSPLLIGFSILSLVVGGSDLRPRKAPQPWVVSHLQAMLGCATVATTAFVVQMVGRSDVSAMANLTAWFLPVGLGQLATIWWTRRVQASNTSTTL